jgi:two-component system nitrogen regulation sensor histidine kinase NtrY
MPITNFILKEFRLGVIVRICLLSLFIFTFCYLLLKTTLYATLIIIGLLVVLQIFGVIRYVNTTNKHLTRFFETVKYSDFSQTFAPSGLGTVFKPLEQAIADVIQAFRATRAEKEEHFRYLQTIVEHINIGLMAYTPSGDIQLINRTAKRLLQTIQLKNIKSLTIDDPGKLLTLAAGDKLSVKINHNQLFISATVVKMKGEPLTLLSIQNIQNELEEKEMEAWQNLIRVLTHEIMNSITPISSLASTVNDLLASDHIQTEADETFDDIKHAIKTIEKRSQGLMHFVNSYHSLTHLPKPKLKTIRVKELLHQVHHLLENDLTCANINCRMEIIPDRLQVIADPNLLEQVLINLILNAIHAVNNSNNPSISVRAFTNIQGRIEMEISDNGCGITEEIRERIFIPFFSTKKEGSGIGLSLCRQIMRLHKGTIAVYSEPGVKTVFTLIF